MEMGITCFAREKEYGSVDVYRIKRLILQKGYHKRKLRSKAFEDRR